MINFKVIAASAVALIIFVSLIVFVGAGTYTSVGPDKIGLHYSGGPIEGTKFQSVVQPGTGNRFYGLADKFYKLPATQRTYSVKRDGTGDTGAPDEIAAPSSDNVPFTFEADVNMFLNRDPEVIRDFFERICLHNECWDLSKGVNDEKGWRQMLHTRLRPRLELAVSQAAKKFSSDDLYNNPQTLEDMNQEVSRNLKNFVNRDLGGDYFCGVGSSGNECEDFNVVVSKPLPPVAVLEKLAETAAAQKDKDRAREAAEAAKITADGDAEANRSRAQGDADAARLRSQAPTLTADQIEYFRAQAMLKCAENSNCTLVVNGSSAGVNVNTGG